MLYDVDQCIKDWCYGVIVSMHVQIRSAAGLVRQKVDHKMWSKTRNCFYTAEQMGSVRLG